MALGADDLHLVAVLQLRQHRRDAAVDLGADRRVAELGVDRISEVDRRRAARQGDEPALGREAEDLILEQFEPRMFEKLLGTVAMGEQIERLLQPAEGAALACASSSRPSSPVASL